MYINNRQKIDDNQKEINDNNIDKNKLNLKTLNKVKLSKLNKNISFLPKLLQENKNKNKNPFIRSSSDVMVNKYQIDAKLKSKKNEKEKDDYKEEILIIKNLWEELGITNEYQIQFNNFLQNKNLRKIMFFQEKEKLQKFRNSLMKFRKEILARENNIESIIKIIKILENQKMQENILNEIINIIKSLRLNAINIVFYLMKIRELAFYYYFQGKWDLTKIKRDYLYKNNYLLKMKDDLSFLNNSILKNYIEMNNITTDAFLTNCSQRYNNTNNNENKIIIPITEELGKLIEQCQFIIIEDELLNNIYNNNYSSQFLSRPNTGKIKIRKNISLNKGQLQHNYNKYNFLKNKDLNNSLVRYPQSSYNSINLSKTIYQLKNDNPSNYNNLFMNSPIPDINSISNLRKKFESSRIKLSPQDKNKYFKNNINNFLQNYESPKRIIIEHDRINSYENRPEKEKENYTNKIVQNNDNNRTKNNNNINTILNSNSNININDNNINNNLNSYSNTNFYNIENEKINNIIKENDKLKKDNEEIKKELKNSKEKIEKNENLRKNLENKLKTQKNEMDKLAKSVEEIKMQLIKEKKELEKKLEEEKEKNKKMEKINKEMEEKIKKPATFNKDIEIQINKNHKNIINNNINENNKSESIKEDEYIQNKSGENKIDNNKNENDDEIKEDFEKKDNENNNIYVLTNSEKNSIQKNNEENNYLSIDNDKNYINENINNIQNNENDNKNNEKINNNKKKEIYDDNVFEKNGSQNDEEANKLIEKENVKIYARQLSEKIVDEIINKKEYEISPNNKYRAECYKGDIISLINKLKHSMPIEKIDNKFKIAFDIENNIYNEDSYLIGQYPQIIICKSYENENEISGICQIYYQNTSKNENKLKINFICAINDINENNEFEQFITMINFVKNYINFDELYITLNYNKNIIEEDKIELELNQEILEFFKIQMKFTYVCIEDLNGQGKKQQLSYKNTNNNMNTSQIYNNKEFFNSETIYLLSFIKKGKDADNIGNKYNNYKYINYFPIYAILTSQKDIMKIDFKDNNYRVDSAILNLEENPILTAFYPENRTIEELKSQLSDEYNNIYNLIEDSLCLEFYEKYKEKDYENNIMYSFGLFKMNLNIYFNNILITKINNYYYNRINSNEIEIIEDIENDCKLYNIPSLNKINNIIIIEFNNKIKNILIENNKNIYELFINYYNKIKKEKNNLINNESKNIYIPSFNVETHLQTEKFSKEINDINIESVYDNNNIMDIKIGTVDEYIKIDFNIKKRIEKQIFYEINNNEKDIVIENEFILGIINNYTEIKYPFFQLIYITKEFWVKVEEKE